MGRGFFALLYFLNYLRNSAKNANSYSSFLEKIIKWKMRTDEMQGNHANSALTN